MPKRETIEIKPRGDGFEVIYRAGFFGRIRREEIFTQEFLTDYDIFGTSKGILIRRVDDDGIRYLLSGDGKLGEECSEGLERLFKYFREK